MVAGGIGQTPFLAWPANISAIDALRRTADGDRPPGEKVTLCYGARTAAILAGVEDFRQAGVRVRLEHRRWLARPSRAGDRADRAGVAGGRPGSCRDRLLRPGADDGGVAQIAAKLGVPCQVSLETPMACGIGICFSCVAKIRDASGGWDYRRTCVEGPVFDAARIEWD